MARKPRKPSPQRSTSPHREALPLVDTTNGPWWREASVCGLLALAVAVAFAPALGMSFLHFDDDIYVWKEPHVATGFTAENWDWAWKGPHAANWHPLTTLSHMLDCEMFGLRPWGHHLVNLILHAFSAILVFLVVKRMSGRFWTSAAVAAVFAVHPLRVESVVWVAERKDLLCAVFFWLTIAAYVAYARRPFSPLRYGLVVITFVLALLAKPMAVSLPFVLLVLDFWPLERMTDRKWSALLLEKLPLLAMSALLCVKTLLVQREAVQLNRSIPFSARALNAVLSYQSYILETFWPAGLAVHYPLPREFSLTTVAIAATLLLVVTGLAIALRRSRPYLLAGWLWYLGMLVPVIGLVQVGRQAMADRYTYLPQIGLLVMIAFSAADLLAARRGFRPVVSAVMVVVLSLLAIASWRQTRFWHDDVTLFQRALDCNEDDAEMQNNMAAAMMEQSNWDAALTYANRTIELDPESASGHASLAKVFVKKSQYTNAIEHARKSVELAPAFAEFRFLYGNALALDRRYRESVPQFQEAIRLRPDQKLYRDQLERVLSAIRRSQ
jgi:tetratricopeptide (TPR) repeat protein